MEITQMHKGDRVQRQPHREKFTEERRRADLMNLSILIRQYPEKAKEFLHKYRLTNAPRII